jgi:hypothetical protein
MFEALKSLFTKSESEDSSTNDEPQQVSDSAGQEGFDDVAEIEELEYESE